MWFYFFHLGAIIGAYFKTPNVDVWENKIFVVPDGIVNLVITNRDYDHVQMCKLKHIFFKY